MSVKNVIDIKVRVAETGTNQFESILLKQYAPNVYDFTLSANAWQGASAPFTQTISGLTGVTTNSEGSLDISQNATLEQVKAAGKSQIRCTSQGQGTVTLTCYGEKPTLDIPCHLSCYN